jgi:hypothetical protein
MKLSVIAESDDVRFVYGYRTLPEHESLLKQVASGGLQVPAPRDSSWSAEPVLYYEWRTKTGVTSNLVEARFNLDDTSYGGFGDGQPFFMYLTDHTYSDLKSQPLYANLPPQLRSRIDALRDQILNDPKYADDWTFAGILPPRYKQTAVELYRDARRYTGFDHPKNGGEFNYIGSLNLADRAGKADSAIVGVFLLRLTIPNGVPKLSDVTAATALYTHSDSKLISILPLEGGIR